MNDFTIGELEKLIKDGIKTVELIQQNPEEFQKTYGRSSIPKQTTRERIQAWEGFAAAKDPNTEQSGGIQGEAERADKAKSPRDSGPDGGNGEANRGDSLFSKARQKTNHQQSGDAENSDGNSSRDRDASTSGSSKDGTRGHPQPSGIDESPGYHADGRVDASDMRQLMMMDHDSSAVETGSLVVPTMTLRNATTEDFAQVFAEGAPKEHRRLRGITTMTSKAKSSDKTTGPVKKGTAESTVSTLLGDVPSSGNGAIQNVHPLLLHQPSSNACAENAPISVRDVSTTWSTTESNEAPCNCQALERKIDLLLATVESANKKLDMLPEIKEEIKNINKKITNLSLGLSTVESYIKSMMIIIPGSGKPDKPQDGGINPDLKAVIGRDKTRGLPELLEQRSNLESLDQDTGYKRKIDKKHIIEDLDFSKSNAANFIPTDDTASFYTITAMIRSEVSDIETQNTLIKWVEDALGDTSMKDIYDMIRSSLDDQSEYNELDLDG
nr:MAG: phosphoprotein [Jingmen rodent jeilongvirus 1]